MKGWMTDFQHDHITPSLDEEQIGRLLSLGRTEVGTVYNLVAVSE